MQALRSLVVPALVAASGLVPEVQLGSLERTTEGTEAEGLLGGSMNTASHPAKYSRTEIAQRVRGALAEELQCEIAAVAEHKALRGTGPGCLGLDAVHILELVSEMEQVFGDLHDVRPIAFDLCATVGHFIDMVEGAVSGGIRS